MKFSYIKLLVLITFFNNIIFSNTYQPIVINNKLVIAGDRLCSDRYIALKKVLNKYKRPFTILDLGAAQGYFSIRAANDYNVTAVMVERDNIDNEFSLLNICKKNTNLKNLIFLKTQFSLDDLRNLAKCEHFDVVLAFNIIHHFPDNWKEITDTILSLGDNIIIDSPYVTGFNPTYRENNKVIAAQKLNDYLNSKKYIELGRFERPEKLGNFWPFGIMRWIKGSRKEIQHVFFGQDQVIPKSSGNFIMKIKSNFSEKKLEITKNDKLIATQKIKPGINICTFKFLNGVYPQPNDILHNIKQLALDDGKKFPWNFKISGMSLEELENNYFDLNVTNLHFDIEKFIDAKRIKLNTLKKLLL